MTILFVDRDQDGDGVNDSVEDQYGGSYYATNSGATILPSAVDGTPVVIRNAGDNQDPDVFTLRNVRAISDSSVSHPPSGVTLPLGLFSFEATTRAPGGSSLVLIEYEAYDGPRLDTYYKFGREPFDDPLTLVDERIVPHWYEFLYDRTACDNGDLRACTGAEFGTRSKTIYLHFIDGQRGDNDLQVDGVISDPGGPAFISRPPSVANVIINDGGPQRSKINSVTIVFNELVAIDSGAFELYRQGRSRPLPVQVGIFESDGRTLARLTFKGHHVVGGSLANGQYTLIIRSDKVRDAGGRQLDGDADGQAGGNYVDEFFRLFGDTDGDGDVDATDRHVFQSAYGKRIGPPGYLWYLDYNANGRIWAEDLALFQLGYGRRAGRR